MLSRIQTQGSLVLYSNKHGSITSILFAYDMAPHDFLKDRLLKDTRKLAVSFVNRATEVKSPNISKFDHALISAFYRWRSLDRIVTLSIKTYNAECVVSTHKK